MPIGTSFRQSSGPHLIALPVALAPTVFIAFMAFFIALPLALAPTVFIAFMAFFIALALLLAAFIAFPGLLRARMGFGRAGVAELELARAVRGRLARMAVRG